MLRSTPALIFGQNDSPLRELPVSSVVIAVAGAVVAILAFAFVLRRLLRRRRVEPTQLPPIEHIDVSELGDNGPPDDGAQLDFYHVPVRLALIVLAPVGRDGVLPAAERLPAVVDQLVPGLMSVLESHQPRFRRWPPQLSSEGFFKIMFSHVPLPGDRGKGTPWCSIAGRFEADGQLYLAGLVCHAAEQNNLSQVVVKHAGMWLDVLRVRRATTS